MLGIDRKPLGPLELSCNGVAQPFRTPGNGVLIDVRGDGLLGSALDLCQNRKVSGKPCARLTAPYSSARRVIPRIADSANRSAFAERPGLMLRARSDLAGSVLAPVEVPVNIRIAHYDLYVLARLGKWN